MREINREKKNDLEEADRFFKDQVTNNKQLEESIKQSEKELVAIRDEQHKITEATGVCTIEVRLNIHYINIFTFNISYEKNNTSLVIYHINS